jgi:hypothetical protein
LQLREAGVNVLGLADEPYDQLNPQLKGALTEYYRVNDMHHYDDLLRACGYFTHHYGKIDRLDSLNEYWLETEARLRTDFNIPGLKLDDMPRIKRKSLMKQTFEKAGVPIAWGKVVHSLAEAKRFIEEIGYPVVAKPDIGVGAAETYKIHNPDELEHFFAVKPPVEYMMEEFIQGSLFSFDGLTDREGNVVFYTSHYFSQGIMETVNQDELLYYYSLREIPLDLEEMGHKSVKAFDIRERFFHIEFFRTKRDPQIVALEVNIRPPGGLTTDMFNYANDIDIYREWANIIASNKFDAEVSRKYYCGYISRKFNRRYAYSHDEILKTFGDCIVHSEAISGIFSPALGDYGYIARSPELKDIFDIVAYIQKPDEA